nr:MULTISPECIES: DotI/IcmL family type IV secretion protein [unclassified Xanthobacter]
MVLTASVVLNLILAYGLIWRFPVKQFLWTSDAKAVCEAIPLDEPNISAARLKDLAATAAVDVYNFDYANWRPYLNSALDKYFTPHGRDEYRADLQKSGLIKVVVDNYLIVSAVTMAPPNVTRSGKQLGRYWWEVEVPLTIYYQTSSSSRRENRLVVFTIVRVEPSPLNPNGVAIDGAISKQLTSDQLNRINSEGGL